MVYLSHMFSVYNIYQNWGFSIFEVTNLVKSLLAWPSKCFWNWTGKSLHRLQGKHFSFQNDYLTQPGQHLIYFLTKRGAGGFAKARSRFDKCLSVCLEYCCTGCREFDFQWMWPSAFEVHALNDSDVFPLQNKLSTEDRSWTRRVEVTPEVELFQYI